MLSAFKKLFTKAPQPEAEPRTTSSASNTAPSSAAARPAATAGFDTAPPFNAPPDGIPITLKSVVAMMPDNLKKRLDRNLTGKEKIAISRGEALRQLPTGSVKMVFREILAQSPNTFSTPDAEMLNTMVTLPLQEILPHIKTLPRRAAQKQIEVPQDLAPVFGTGQEKSREVKSAPAPMRTGSRPAPPTDTTDGPVAIPPPRPQPIPRPAPVVPKPAPAPRPVAQPSPMPVIAAAPEPEPVAMQAPPEPQLEPQTPIAFKLPMPEAPKVAPAPRPAPAPVPPPAPVSPAPIRVAPVAPVRVAAPAPPPIAPQPIAPTPIAVKPAVPPPPAFVPPPPAPVAAPAAAAAEPAMQFGEIFGEPEKTQWSPQEIVEKAANLKGVAGALITTVDGLPVAFHMPSNLSGNAVAAFVPQMYTRIMQYVRDLKLGDAKHLTILIETTPLQIFRSGSVYFTALGKANESLPKPQLTAIAAALGRPIQP